MQSLKIQIVNVQQKTVKNKIHNVGSSSKRYSQFRDLYKSLCDNRPLLQGQCEKIPKLPTWTNLGALFSNKLSKDNLQKRRYALEKWLNLISPINVARSFDDFRKFLKLNRRGFAQWANMYGGVLKVDPKTKKVKLVKIDPNAMLSKNASSSSFKKASDTNIRTPSPIKNRNSNHNGDSNSQIKQSPMSGILASRTVQDIKKINFEVSNEDLSDLQKQQSFLKEEDKNLLNLKANEEGKIINQLKNQEIKSEERQFNQNFRRVGYIGFIQNFEMNRKIQQDQYKNSNKVQKEAFLNQSQQKTKASSMKQQQKLQQISFDEKVLSSLGAKHHERNKSDNSFGAIYSARNQIGDRSQLIQQQDDFDQSGLDRSVIIDFSDMKSSQHRFGKSFIKYDSVTQQQVELQEQGSGINTSFQLKSPSYFGMDFEQ